MRSLVDIIEQHIRSLLQQSGRNAVELRRNHLAEQFRCAPSQVSYVLSTRFTVERGYVVETRRGGGGFVRVACIPMSLRDVTAELAATIGDAIGPERAVGYVYRLWDKGLVSRREASLMRAAVDQAGAGLESPVRDYVRAGVLRAMIAAVCQGEEEPS